MTEDTWGLLRVCPGAEVRQSGRKRQGGRAAHVGEAEQSCALLELCSFQVCWWPLGLAGVAWTDLLLRVLLQEDVRMAKKEFLLTQKRSGSNGRMTRG